MDFPVEKLLALPLEQRLEILERLRDSVDEELEAMEIPEEIIAEAMREVEADAADPESSIPWEVVRAKLRAKHG